MTREGTIKSTTPRYGEVIPSLTKHIITMKTNMNIKRFALLFVAAACMLSTACTKENSQNGNSDSAFTLAKADVTYKLTLQASSADAMRKAYDVFIDFYDANGHIQTTTEVNADNLAWNKELTLNTFPAWFGAQFRLVPKSDLSAVGENEKFNFDGTFSIKGTGTSTKGKTRSVGEDSQLIQHSGLNPRNGRSYKKCCRFQVQTDGTYQSNMEWE